MNRAQQSQNNAKARSEGTPVGATPPRGRQSRTANQRPAVTATTTAAPQFKPPGTTLSPAQQQALRSAAAHAAHEHEEHEHQAKQMLDNQRILAAQKAAQQQKVKAAMQKIDPSLLQGFQNSTSTKGLMGTPINPGSKAAYSVGQKVGATQYAASVKNSSVPAKPAPIDPENKNPFVPQPPNKGGRGI